MALQAWRYCDSHHDSEGLEGAASTRFPTSEEITAKLDAAIGAANPGLILWFTLWDVIGWDGNQRPWYWEIPSDPDQRWGNLVQGAFAPHGTYPGRPPPPAADNATTPLAHRPSGASTSRVGKRMLLKAKASPATSGKDFAMPGHIDGRRLSGCAGRRCAFRARRSGAHRIALLVDDGDRCATAHKRLCIAKSAHGWRRR
jgi:hypothetical protein